MTIRDNTFTITCKNIVDIKYRVNSAYVSPGQSSGQPPEIPRPDSSGKWTITFKAGRQKTVPVAQSFISVSGGSQYTMVVGSSGDKVPEALNFYFGLDVTVNLPSGARLDNILIYVGQGSDGIDNNWWLGSTNLINPAGRTVLLGTQSGQIAWRAFADMDTSSCNISAITPNAPNPIELLDVWGEGRRTDGGVTTGFNNSLNLNKYNQKISAGPTAGQPIPQQVPVFDYDTPYFPIPDGSVAFVTLMGAPIVAGTAREIVRVLDPKKGVVILYNPTPQHLAIWESNMGNLVFKPGEPLKEPFNQITIPNPHVYGVRGVVDDIVDRQEL